MTVREFVDWQRFHIEHPFPADLIDMHGARAMALQANIHRREEAPAFDPRDFMVIGPFVPKPAPEEKPAQSEAQRLRAEFEAGG